MKLRTVLIVFLILSFVCGIQMPKLEAYGPDEFLVLCFHDIPEEVKNDKLGVDRKNFVATIEFLRANGYQFISMDDVIRAHKGEKHLPPKAVLLTFDDAYKSFYDFVFPLLKRYGFPSVLAVVTHWVKEKPTSLKNYELMTEDELRKVAKSDLVEIASHSHNLHRGILYNPQGNEAAAAASRIYIREKNQYENEKNYRKRIYEDLLQSKQWIQNHLGVDPRSIVWPYGRYNSATLEEAKRAGFQYGFTLTDLPAKLGNLEEISRVIISRNPTVLEFAKNLKVDFNPPLHLRTVQVDLDLIYDLDPTVVEKNLSALLDRMAELKPDVIFLQAFADPEGSGNIKSVYFPNRLLPMRADLFNRVLHQLRTRSEVLVYAWMPVLSIVLPGEPRNDLRVWEFDGKNTQPSHSWYHRLSPFHPEVREKLKMLYQDLAVNATIDGVVFQDDGYLNDYEDFNPAALPYYERLLGRSTFLPSELSDEEMKKWTELKTDTLLGLTKELMDVVRYWRCETYFAGTLYAEVVMNPYSETWYAQNYEKSLALYDYTVLMAYPRMEKVKRPKKWLKELVNLVKAHPQGISKTIFKVQTYDWVKKEWIKSKTVSNWLKYLVAEGVRHTAYYPDHYALDRPKLDVIRTVMSKQDFPFKKK